MINATETHQHARRLLTRAEIVKLASREVDRWFASVASNIFMLTAPGDHTSDNLGLQSSIRDHLEAHREAADVAQFGEITPGEDLKGSGASVERRAT